MQRVASVFKNYPARITWIRRNSSTIPMSNDIPVPPTEGRAQPWRDPIYVGPYVNPLQRGPDYKVVGGIRPLATTKFEVERLQQQLELGKQIVQCLKQIKEAEQLYAVDQKSKESLSNEKERWTPASKGSEEIY